MTKYKIKRNFSYMTKNLFLEGRLGTKTQPLTNFEIFLVF